MRAFPVVVGSRGRIVLPHEVRAELGLTEGDTVFLVVGPDGVRLARSPESYAEWMGLHGSGPAFGPSPEELDLPAAGSETEE